MISQSIVFLSRAIREPAVHTTAAVALMPAAAAGLRAAGVSTDLDTAALAKGLFEANLWITLGMAAVFGGLGGIVAELLSLHGRIELPHRVQQSSNVKRSRLADPRHEIDLGIAARVVLGATAGLALLSVYAPTNPTALVVNALIAGSAATAVFRMVQGRMLARVQGPAPRTQKAAPKPQLTVVGGSQSTAVQ
jgi:hypothetical protein